MQKYYPAILAVSKAKPTTLGDEQLFDGMSEGMELGGLAAGSHKRTRARVIDKRDSGKAIANDDLAKPGDPRIVSSLLDFGAQ